LETKPKEICFDGPRRPWLVKLINGLDPFLSKTSLAPKKLNFESLIKEAQSKTKLSDFGDHTCFEGLKVLLQSLEEENELNTIGTIVAKQLILNGLINRLKIIHHRKSNPLIENEKIVKPIFILGLPRTGTTLLHYLISLDKEIRFTPTWESFHPCPPVKKSTLDNDRRISKTKRELMLFWKLIPNIRSVHDFDHLTPQECIVFMGHTFNTFALPTQFYIPKYMNWLQHSDLDFLYTEHKRMLQLMQSGGHRNKHWILKAPAHIFCIDQILKVYPDAHIIQTHRDPIRAIASSCSLNYALAQLTSDHLELNKFGNLHLNVLSDWLVINTTQRSNYKERSTQFYDLNFNEFVRDPISNVRNIYDHFNLNWTQEFENDMCNYIQNDSHLRFGKHIYSPEQFGIDPINASEKIESYKDYFSDFLT